MQAQARTESEIAKAITIADLAKREVDALNTEKYEAIKSLLQVCETRSNSAVNLVTSIEESLKTVQNKLASRERQEKAAERKVTKSVPEDDEPETGSTAEISELVKNGKAFALAMPQHPPQSAKPPRRFGSLN
jgi:hypothetical protein